MRLTSTGLGIGTSSPAEKLTVNGAIAVTGGITGHGANRTTLSQEGANGAFWQSYGANTSTIGTFKFRQASSDFSLNRLAMEIDSSGNLGLGVTPSAWVTTTTSRGMQFGRSGSIFYSTDQAIAVFGNNYFQTGATSFTYLGSGFASRYTQSDFNGSHSWFTAPSGTAGNAISFTQAMTLDASGNLALGATSANEKVMIASSTSASYIQICDSSTGATSGDGIFLGSFNGAAELKTKENNSLSFGTNNTERARIDSNGNLLVATNTSGGQGGMSVRIGGFTPNVLFNRINTTAQSFPLEFQNAGTIVGYVGYNNTSTFYVTSSDYRLKNSIAPMTGALAKVALLKPCTYKWNADGSDGQGFIAHELAEVVPQCVTGEKDAVDAEGKPQYQGIDTSFLVATLTAALQEAHGLIKDLQARVDALEGK
jgi:hypothetical protein